MFCSRNLIWFLAGLTVCFAGSSVVSSPCPAAAAEPAIPPELRAIVDRHLRADPSYRPGDLISRSQVAGLVESLLKAGVYDSAAEGDDLYRDYLRDDDYLVLLMRTPRGRAFAQKIQGIPDVYDRLERLSWTPVGRSWLPQLVAAENGDELLAGMLTEAGLKQVEAALASDGRERNFRLPTGRVHTEQDLLVRLQEIAKMQNGKRAMPTRTQPQAKSQPQPARSAARRG